MGQLYSKVKENVYVNMETGETQVFRTVTKPVYKGKHFWKVFMENVVPVLELIGNKHVQILTYILRNLDEKDNTFSRTYKEISQDVHVNESTIAITMKKLQDCGFIALQKGGEWIVHSDMLYKGSEDRRHKIIHLFNECDKRNSKRNRRNV